MIRRPYFLVFMAVVLTTAWAFPNDEDRYVKLTRISYLEGNVSYQRSSDADWSAASINMPLEPGDRIYTGPNGRTEIEFEDGAVLQLAENTDVEILVLDENLVQLRMLAGLATLTASRESDFEINTPAAAFNAVREGIYRFEVDEDGRSDAIVRNGKLEAANNFFSRTIDSGQRIRVRPGTDGNREVMAYDRRDSWDEWTDRRSVDRRSYASRRYLPDNVHMGAAELDRYGRWVYVASYGWGWIPYSVGSYWSPYSVGRWVYRPFFGWVWVSYEPWGWLPYHYGRWYQDASFGWTWFPGAGFSFNFWSPGLVAFYRGPGWVSWCPLGPGDYYDVRRYHYRRGVYGYQLDRLRALHRRGPGDYINRNARGAFRTADIDHFRRGSFNERSVASRWGNIDQPWRQGTLVRDRLDIQPNRESYRPAPDRRAERSRIDRDRPVVVRRDPPRNDGNRDRFTRITNPQIPSPPSRWNAAGNERSGENQRQDGSGPDSSRRSAERSARDRSSAQPGQETGTRSLQQAPQNRARGGVMTGNPQRPAPERPNADRTEGQTEQGTSGRSVQSGTPRWRYEPPAIPNSSRQPATETPSVRRTEERGTSPRERSASPAQPENRSQASGDNSSRGRFERRTVETPRRQSAPDTPAVQESPSRGRSETRAVTPNNARPERSGSSGTSRIERSTPGSGSTPSRVERPAQRSGSGSSMGRWGGGSGSGQARERRR